MLTHLSFLEGLDTSLPSSCACFCMWQRLHCEVHVWLLHNTCLGLSYLKCSETQGLQARLCGNPHYRDPDSSRTWGTAGMGPRELSLVGICNLSPSTKLVGNSKCSFTCPKISCPDFQHNGMRRRSWSYARGVLTGVLVGCLLPSQRFPTQTNTKCFPSPVAKRNDWLSLTECFPNIWPQNNPSSMQYLSTTFRKYNFENGIERVSYEVAWTI